MHENVKKRAELPADSVITFAIKKMQERIKYKDKHAGLKQEQSGLIYMGNIHYAYPRRLLLDKRLSPTDKTAWLLIRHYAMQNEGAVFPAYKDLKNMLAEPGRISASGETVARVLTMLRMTGWLSLCKKVRDLKSGRIVGNIYAQHDEPLSVSDCEIFDPGWINLVEKNCFSRNFTIRHVACQVINNVKQDNSMRHRHSRVGLIEERLACNDKIFGIRTREKELKTPYSESEHGEKGLKSGNCHRVRNPNSYVRSITQCVKTYVRKEPEQQQQESLTTSSVTKDPLADYLPISERTMIDGRLTVLSEIQREAVISCFLQACREQNIKKPVAYLLKLIQKACNGEFHIPQNHSMRSAAPVTVVCPEPETPDITDRKSDPQKVQQVVDDIRKQLKIKKAHARTVHTG